MERYRLGPQPSPPRKTENPREPLPKLGPSRVSSRGDLTITPSSLRAEALRAWPPRFDPVSPKTLWAGPRRGTRRGRSSRSCERSESWNPEGAAAEALALSGFQSKRPCSRSDPSGPKPFGRGPVGLLPAEPKPFWPSPLRGKPGGAAPRTLANPQREFRCVEAVRPPRLPYESGGTPPVGSEDPLGPCSVA